MSLKIYIGSATEIDDRFLGAPSSTTTTVATVTSKQIFTLASATSFADGDSIVVGQYKAVIEDITGVTVTLVDELPELPTVGATVKHYNADYTKYRDAKGSPLTFVDDRSSGGSTGDSFGRDLVLVDYDGSMPIPTAQSRITIFDSVAPTVILFGGVVNQLERVVIGAENSGAARHAWKLIAKGYLAEADTIGIEEPPQLNINAGEYLRYLMGKYTTLAEGAIDTTNSPTLDYIRISNYRRFSDVAADIANLWPEGEFFIENGQSNGLVYFRQKVTAAAPISLSETTMKRWGPGKARLAVDYDKTFNVVRFPYYEEQQREPDLFVQSVVTDDAFLKTSVVLNGQPANLEESTLLLDDFGDGELDEGWLEDDLTNPSPPTGFIGADGFLVEGEVNTVGGLHLLDTASASPAAQLGDIGRQSDPGVIEPWTGAERQLIYMQELVLSGLGDAIVCGIIDQSTVSTLTTAGSTTTTINVASVTGFVVGDRITVGASKTYVTTVGGSSLDVSPALPGAPAAGVTVALHQLATSRVNFGILFKASGDLKYIKNGTEYAFSTPRTYTASPTTYSLRVFMQSFESTIASGVSSTGCTLVSGTNFATGDVVEIFTQGSRVAPEKRVVTVSGDALTYSATDYTPAVGYRVRTLPKIVVQIKGGAYGSITGRDWTTIHTEANTYQTSATVEPDERGVLMVSNKSLEGTITLFQVKNPIPITGNIGSRYLHIGTQEVDSSEADVDCIVRKVGSHFQLDFFPDSKSLWASGSTLELRYTERWRYEYETRDSASMTQVAKARGFSVPTSISEAELLRKGGRVLDTIQILPNPLTRTEALQQAKAVLEAVKEPAVLLEVVTDSIKDGLAKSGQMVASSLPGIPDLQIQSVTVVEIPGAGNEDGSAVFDQVVVAGTVDRLKDVLLKRQIKNGQRLVIDDGRSDDTFTKLQSTSFTESVTAGDAFTVYECADESLIVYDSGVYSPMACLLVYDP